MTAAPARRYGHGRRMTRAAQAVQNGPPLSTSVAQGSRTRSRSTRRPASASSAGSSVTAASTAMQTTRIAPTASDRIPFTSIANRPASETATVVPLKTTALPDVRSARRRASCGSAPSASSPR